MEFDTSAARSDRHERSECRIVGDAREYFDTVGIVWLDEDPVYGSVGVKRSRVLDDPFVRLANGVWRVEIGSNGVRFGSVRNRRQVHLQHDRISVFISDLDGLVRITRETRRDHVEVVGLKEGFGVRPRENVIRIEVERRSAIVVERGSGRFRREPVAGLFESN